MCLSPKYSTNCYHRINHPIFSNLQVTSTAIEVILKEFIITVLIFFHALFFTEIFHFMFTNKQMLILQLNDDMIR